jgi:HlyD family secretion protein
VPTAVSESVFEARGITKVYHMGEVEVPALRGVDLDLHEGDRPLQGRVRRVEPSGFLKISALGVEEQRVNAVVDFAEPAEAWRALGDGYRVELRIVVSEGSDVLKAPTSSLFRVGDA